jgi:peptide/nickel transport system permease protein
MGRYVLQRVFGTAFVLFGVVLIAFVITHVVPADPARVAAGLQATPEQVEALRKQMGLDLPVHVQLARYLRDLARGTLGTSFVSNRPVARDILLYFPATLELVTVATVVFLGLGLPLGVFLTVSRSNVARFLTRLLAVTGMGVPAFWLGLMFQLLFYAKLNWLPPTGRITGTPPPTVTGLFLVDSLVAGDLQAFGSALTHLILPSLTLAANRFGVTVRMTSAQLTQVLREDYVRTARAKGLSNKRVVYKHALRNALIPVTTMTGLQLGWMLGGTVLVETVFSWPGLGQYAFFSIAAFDFRAVIAVTILLSFCFAFINLITDLVYVVLDPRISV